MKRIILVALILGCATYAFSQNRFGLECGVSAPSFSVGTADGAIGYRHNAVIKPMVGLDYLRKVDRHVYLGARLGLEAYSFYFSKTDSVKAEIKHFSSYLTFAPTVDFGFGPHQYWHLFVAMTMGFLTNASETTGTYAPGTYQDPSVTYNSSDQVSGFIFRPGIGLKQHIPINRFWHITISESFSYMATDLTHVSNLGAVHPGTVALQMGFMRKFHRPKMITNE